MSVDIRQEAPSIGLASGWLMVLRIFPFARNAYDNSLRNLMDGMSEESFRKYHPFLVGMVRLTKRNSKRFRNSNKETESLLKQYPKLNNCRGDMFDRVKAHRRKCKFN